MAIPENPSNRGLKRIIDEQKYSFWLVMPGKIDISTGEADNWI